MDSGAGAFGIPEHTKSRDGAARPVQFSSPDRRAAAAGCRHVRGAGACGPRRPSLAPGDAWGGAGGGGYLCVPSTGIARCLLATGAIQPPGAVPAASAGHVPTSPVSRASYAPTPTVPSPVLLLRLRPGLTLWHGTDCLASPPLLCFALLAQLILALSTVPFPSPCLARLARKHFPPSLLTRRVIF